MLHTPPPDETLAPTDSDAPAWDAAPASGIRAPTHARYLLRQEIARGGLGRVLEAEDQELGRPVALKELLHDSPGNRARFLREIRFTARLQHPSIVPIYDAVPGEDGVLRYAMKLVSGTTLVEAIAATQTLDERVALLPHLLSVADAVAYAHARGVIHRDIKPQNILLGDFGETLLIDWGIAKDLGDSEEDAGVEEESEDAGLTRSGAVVGTPAYMAPEQARGEAADRRSDVYSLGATLYHLLSGATPFGMDAAPTLLALCNGQCPMPLEKKVPNVPPDLASIVYRAMNNDPLARYPSAQELRQDLQRFTTGQLVAAQRYTRTDLLRRWIFRHRAILSVLSVAAILVIVSAGLATERVVEERNIARSAQALAEARSNALTLAHAARSTEGDPTEAANWLAAYPPDAADPERFFMLAQDVVFRGVAPVVVGPPDVNCDTPIFSADGGSVFTVGTTTLPVEAQTGAYSANAALGQFNLGVPLGQKSVLVANYAGAIYQLDSDGKQRLITTILNAPMRMVTNGSMALVGDRSGGITRIDLSTQNALPLVTTSARITGLALHGDFWSAASGDGSVWTGANDGSPPRLRFKSASPLLQLSALHDGTLLLGDENGTITLLDPSDHPQRLLQLKSAIRLLALGDHENLLVASDGSGVLKTLRLNSGIQQIPPWGEKLALGLDVAPQDGRVAVVLEDGLLHIWRPETNEEQIRRERGKLAGPVTFSADGRSLATCAVDNKLRIWSAPMLEGRLYRGHAGRIFHPIFLADGKVATDSDDQTVRIWSADTMEGQVLRGHQDQVYGLEASPDGRHIVSASADGLAIIWDVLTGAPSFLRGHTGRVRRAIFTPDGQRVLTGARDGTLRAWSLDGSPLQVTEAHPGGVHWMALSPDGRHVWSVGRDRSLRRWDPESGRIDTVAEKLGAEGGRVLRVFPLAGERALTCADERTLVEISADQRRRIFPSPQEVMCPSMELSPDGRFLAVPMEAHLSLLDLETGHWRSLGTFPAEIHSVEWSFDGHLLALAMLDGTARLLRVSDGAGAIVTRSDSGILGVRFSPDGRLLAAGGIDQTLWVGPIQETLLLPRDPAALSRMVSSLTHARLTEAAR